MRQGLSKVAEDLGGYALSNASLSSAEQEPRFNIAPTQSNLVLRKAPGAERSLQAASMRWGLVPSWSRTPSTQAPMINARSETVAEKPSFRAAFQRRRCLVPSDGFYEWKKRKGASLPFHFSLLDDAVFLMAGIWETWVSERNESFSSYTILTTQANSLLAKYHDRMPVILQGDRIQTWLEADPHQMSPAEQHKLFSPLDASLMTCRPANPLVNNNKSEGPECLEAPEEVEMPQMDLGF